MGTRDVTTAAAATRFNVPSKSVTWVSLRRCRRVASLFAMAGGWRLVEVRPAQPPHPPQRCINSTAGLVLCPACLSTPGWSCSAPGAAQIRGLCKPGKKKAGGGAGGKVVVVGGAKCRRH